MEDSKDNVFKFPTGLTPEYGDYDKVCVKCWWSREATYGKSLVCKRRHIEKVNMSTGKFELSTEQSLTQMTERHGYDCKEKKSWESDDSFKSKLTSEAEKCGAEGKYFLNKVEVETAKNFYPDRFIEGEVPVPLEILQFLQYNEEEDD